MSRYDITQAYMMTWDIPYYLRYFGRGLSLAQNVDAMFFEDRAPLKDEFDSLFSSLFSNPGVMATIAKALNTKDRGLTRTELPEATGIAYSGEFSRHLRAFVTGAFVTKYISFGNGRREAFYELTDTSACSGCASCGSRRPGRPTGSTSRTRGRWSHGGGMPSRTSAGIGQIKAALGISGVSTSESLWSKRGNERERGAQIDLIISCGDSVVNMCWAKFCSGEFSVDRDYHFTLVRRKVLLQGLVPKKGSMTNPVATTQSIPSQTRGADGGTVEGRCGNQIARAAKSSFPILRKISFAIGFVIDLTRGYGLTLVAFHGS